MEYVSTKLPSALSVKGIFTVLTPDLTHIKTGRGEAHDFPEIFFLDRGEHTLIVDGKEIPLNGGEMAIYAPGSYHSSAAPSDSTALIISFDVESSSLHLLYNRAIKLTDGQVRTFREIFNVAKDCFKRRNPEDTVGGMLLRDGVDEYTLQRIRLKLEIFLTEVLENATQAHPSAERKMAKRNEEYLAAIDFLRENLSRSLTLSEIAEGCSMSVSKLKLLFREKHGTGPIACFIELKIEEAKRLILDGEMNFSEIAEALGFNSLHYFSRLFKSTTGLSPSEYAKRI